MPFSVKDQLVLILLLSVLVLPGCGGGGGGGGTTSSSSSSTTADTAVAAFPYGVEELVSTTDVDGDGHWDTRTTVSYQYNDEMQIVEVQTITEYDVDADGIVDSKDVVTETYQPSSLTATALLTSKSALTALFDPDSIGGWNRESPLGAPVQLAFESYELNENGFFYSVPSQRREQTYRYAADGTLVEYGVEEWEYSFPSEELSSHSVDTLRYTYDSAGYLVRYLYEQVDENSDGVCTSLTRLTKNYTYDALGTLTYYLTEDIEDTDGDGPLEAVVETSSLTFDHTYDDNRLVETLATPSVATSYSITYQYNVAGLLSVKQFSYDNYDVSADVDTVITLTYAYDDDGRLVHFLKNTSTDENEDGVVDVVETDDYEWSYDENGLLTRRFVEYSVNEEDAGGLQEHTESLDEYEYTAGLLSRYHDRYQMDTDLDGDMDRLDQETLINYRYENGYLSGFDVEGAGMYGSIFDVGSVPYQMTVSVNCIYQDGLLVSYDSSQEWYNPDDRDNPYDYNFLPLNEISHAAFTYDGEGHLIEYATTFDDYANGVIDETEEFSFDYSLNGEVVVSSQLSNGDGVVESDLTLDFGASPSPVGSGPKDIYNMYTPVAISYPFIGAFHETDVDYETHYVSFEMLVPKLMSYQDLFEFDEQMSIIIVDGSFVNVGVFSLPSPWIYNSDRGLYDGNPIQIDPSMDR